MRGRHVQRDRTAEAIRPAQRRRASVQYQSSRWKTSGALSQAAPVDRPRARAALLVHAAPPLDMETNVQTPPENQAPPEAVTSGGA